jgi:hypothetical protein
MKTSSRFDCLAVLIVMMLILGSSLPAHVADPVEQIPRGPTTCLPDYVGAPAKAHPSANSGVPQNPLLAPNPSNSVHLDPWMSDTADIAGPLGRDPASLSSTLVEARQEVDPLVAPEWIFNCIVEFFDSHGRVIAVCFSPTEATVVLADPDSLEVLSHYHLETPDGDPYKGGRQKMLRSLGSLYSFLDARDQLTLASGGDQLITLGESGSEDHPMLVQDEDNLYDLSDIKPAESDLAGVMLDWQGRIWFTTAEPATVWVLNPATYSEEEPNVMSVELADNEGPDVEVVRNTFSLTKTGVDRAAAYVVTSKRLYRVEAGADDSPHIVWSEPYDTIDEVRLGQYELGSGTSPTILGEGKYVAITDNAEQLQVVVFRTDEQLDPNEERIVCKVPVFNFPGGGAGALSNSLIGSRLSLIATNNDSYWFDWETGELLEPSKPGVERIDVDPNGKGCTKVWSNTEVATTTCPRLSTKTGLIYTMARKMDESKVDVDHPYGLDVYYWTAIDFRTGETVWQKMAGTGSMFDSFYPGLGIGPNEALYYGGYGGLMSIRDTY